MTIHPLQQITLEDDSTYYYSVKPYEMMNVLGMAIAPLLEFNIFRNSEENAPVFYRLYKTKEGSWYEISSAQASIDHHILRKLKTGIDRQEDPVEKEKMDLHL